MAGMGFTPLSDSFDFLRTSEMVRILCCPELLAECLARLAALRSLTKTLTTPITPIWKKWLLAVEASALVYCLAHSVSRAPRGKKEKGALLLASQIASGGRGFVPQTSARAWYQH
jgi:hypothetical protein